MWFPSLSFSVLVWSQLHKNATLCKFGWGDSVQTPAYQMGTIVDLLLLIQLPFMSCTTCLIQSEWRGWWAFHTEVFSTSESFFFFSRFLFFFLLYLSWFTVFFFFLIKNCMELTHWKRPWCWERLKAKGEGDDTGWDGWMASLTWTWANSGRQWRTQESGVWQSMESQGVGHDLATE